MEQSTKINHNENITPSAPAINFNQQTHQGGFVQPPYQGGFVQPTNQGGFFQLPHQGGFVQHPPIGTYPGYPQHGAQTQPGYVNAGFQPEFNQRPGFVPLPQQPVTTNPTIIITHSNTHNDSYCGRLNDRRQTRSISGGTLLMLISGLHLGWGIYRLFIPSYLLGGNLQIFVIMAWSLGAFFGGFVGSPLSSKLKKKFIYLIAAAVVAVGNLLIIIWDKDKTAIIVGRLLLGAAHGVTYVALVTHAGENASKNLRGTILSSINSMLYGGIFVSAVANGTMGQNYFGLYGSEIVSAERLISIVGIICAVVSIVCTLTATVETVPFLLHRNDRNAAMANLKYLRNSYHETVELTQELEEFNLMVGQDKQDSCNIFTGGNARPLVLMIMLRLMVALTNNLSMNYLLINFTVPMFYYHQYHLMSIAFVAPRFFMSIAQMFYGDSVARKKQFIVSFALAALFLILFRILHITLVFTSPGQLYAVCALIFVVQFACGIGMDQMQHVYLSEAFSTAKKAWSISFVAAFEHAFHIFMIGMLYIGYADIASISVLMFVSGGVIIVVGLILAFTLPETRGTSLKQARDAFANHSARIVSPFA